MMRTGGHVPTSAVRDQGIRVSRAAM
jgi:hypothetical protein